MKPQGTQRCISCGFKHRRRSNELRPCSKCGEPVTDDLLAPGPEARDPDQAPRTRPVQRCIECGHRHRRITRVGRPCDVCEGEVESIHAPVASGEWSEERIASVLRSHREEAQGMR